MYRQALDATRREFRSDQSLRDGQDAAGGEDDNRGKEQCELAGVGNIRHGAVPGVSPAANREARSARDRQGCSALLPLPARGRSVGAEKSRRPADRISGRNCCIASAICCQRGSNRSFNSIADQGGQRGTAGRDRDHRARAAVAQGSVKSPGPSASTSARLTSKFRA